MVNTVYTKLEVTNQCPFNQALTTGDMGKAIHGKEITVTRILSIIMIKEVMYWSDIIEQVDMRTQRVW